MLPFDRTQLGELGGFCGVRGQRGDPGHIYPPAPTGVMDGVALGVANWCSLQSLLAFEQNPAIGRLAAFPDIHFCSERSIPVGVAFQTTDVFYPLVTGKDMGCGVAYLRLPRTDVLQPFDKARHYRATTHKADREPQESQSAPTSRPAKHQPKPPQAA